MAAKADLLLCSGIRQIRQRESERVRRWDEWKDGGVRKRKRRRKGKGAARVPFCCLERQRGLWHRHGHHHRFCCYCCQIKARKEKKWFFCFLSVYVHFKICKLMNGDDRQYLFLGQPGDFLPQKWSFWHRNISLINLFNIVVNNSQSQFFSEIKLHKNIYFNPVLQICS